MIKKLSLMILLPCVIVLHSIIHADTHKDQQHISSDYLSEKYKATIDLICDITHPDTLSPSLKNLSLMLEKNEFVATLQTIINGTKDALDLLNKAQDQFADQSQFTLINKYLTKYEQALNANDAFVIMTADNEEPTDVILEEISDEQYLEMVEANSIAITRQTEGIFPFLRGPRGHRGHRVTADITGIMVIVDTGVTVDMMVKPAQQEILVQRGQLAIPGLPVLPEILV